MSTQFSFETRIGRFVNANELIQGEAAYNAVNALISKAGYTAYITSVNAANTAVTNTFAALDALVQTRKQVCFVNEDSNPDCAERRIMGVQDYLQAELNENHPIQNMMERIVKKIRPQNQGATGTVTVTIKAGQSKVINNVLNTGNATNTGNTNIEWNEVGGPNPPAPILPGETETITAPSGSVLFKNFDVRKAGKIKVEVKTDSSITNSSSEKTYTALVRYLTDIITDIGTIGGGFVYSPANTKLSVADLTALRNQINSLNTQIQAAEKLYGNANRARRELYDNTKTGMQKRIALTKKFITHMTDDGEQGNLFIEYSQAIEGT